MTIRLVALMSAVLLLSLAAFGLLLHHSQGQVFEEVAHTASEVGRAAFTTFDFVVAGPDEPDGADADVTAPGDPTASTVTRSFSWVVTSPAGGDADAAMPAPSAVDDERRLDGRVTRVRRVQVGTDDPSVFVECTGADVDDCPAFEHLALPATAAGHMLVQVDKIRAEPDPDAGTIVLKIPHLGPVSGPEGATATATTTVAAAGVAGVPPSFDELELPVPTGDLDALFSTVRRRSLLLFVGVFALGTALSAGLASRFTRPIRRLDAGLRRLSDGDLDVRVETHGRDEIARLGAAFNDMTRKLRANRERERQMVRREKLSALGRLAAGVAHDVRNPLHSISLTLDHLTEAGRPESDERQREFDRSVEIIRGEVRRLDRLVGNFLRFARSDRRERAPIDLGDLLRETERLVAKEAEWRGVALELDLADDVPSLLGDGESLRSSILNLVLNSFEAMPDGGRLRIALRRAGGHAAVSVTDTGHGIAEEDRERVFEFAYTTREGGSGLGLAMVHQCVVEEHGGRVSLDSDRGRGTTITMELPLEADSRGNAA